MILPCVGLLVVGPMGEESFAMLVWGAILLVLLGLVYLIRSLYLERSMRIE